MPPVLCTNEQDCPNDYWCNNIGIQSKGLCCPLPSKQLLGDAKCKSMEPFIEYNKSCDIHCRAGFFYFFFNYKMFIQKLKCSSILLFLDKGTIFLEVQLKFNEVHLTNMDIKYG